MSRCILTGLLALALAPGFSALGATQRITIMAANLTSGSAGKYEGPGERIFKGLNPDIVAIQEWNVTNAGGRHAFVDSTFGTNFSYYVEPAVASDIPNGIISRWPIVDSGEWGDTNVPNRDYAWATIEIPGAPLLHVVSVHLKASDTPDDRNTRTAQARALTNHIATSFSPTNYVVLCGDLNLATRSETALSVLTNKLLSDSRKPADQNGETDTSMNRNYPYDFVLPNPTLNSNHTAVVIGANSFTNGLVFDSRVWASPPSPILTNDSGALNMQHMGVLKTFTIPALADADLDGMDDSWEIANFGSTTNADAATDWDKDRFTDLEEFLAGTMPTNALSALRFEQVQDLSSGRYAVSWSSVTGRQYLVLRGTNIAGSFGAVASNLVATPPRNSYTDAPPASLDLLFYRVQLSRP